MLPATIDTDLGCKACADQQSCEASPRGCTYLGHNGGGFCVDDPCKLNDACTTSAINFEVNHMYAADLSQISYLAISGDGSGLFMVDAVDMRLEYASAWDVDYRSITNMFEHRHQVSLLEHLASITGIAVSKMGDLCTCRAL